MRKKTYLKLAEYQTEQSRHHLEKVRSIHREMRGYKHDFHHHLQTLKGQLEAGETGRALAYIEQLDHQLMNMDTLLKTGNISLDAILSSMLNSAGKKEKKAGTLFSTHKNGIHGFGLRRAQAILKEHGGWCKYNSEDGAFTSEFLVPALE